MGKYKDLDVKIGCVDWVDCLFYLVYGISSLVMDSRWSTIASYAHLIVK